jgi:hypothetical protein
MPKPDAEQFARIVLWHLAGIRADLIEMHSDIAQLQGRIAHYPSEKVRKADNLKVRNDLYREALNATGLDSSRPPPDGL